MREQLIKYIEFLFKDSPDATDLKNEIMSNTLDKFDDMVASGTSEESAFNYSVSGIGDISSLLNEKKKETEYEAAGQKPRAIMLAVAIALYILSIVPCIMLDGNDTLAPSLMFAIIAVATALIIYRSTAYKKYEAKNDTESERIKERNSEENGRTILRQSLRSAVWALTVAIYFIVSFATYAWYVTWVIFIIGAAISNIIGAVFSLAGDRK